MRIPDSLSPSTPLWLTLTILGVVASLVFPRLRKDLQGHEAIALSLLALGGILNQFPVASSGGGLFLFSLVPSIAILFGSRLAFAAVLIYGAGSMLLRGPASGDLLNVSLNFLLAWASATSCKSYVKRLPAVCIPFAPVFAVWFAYVGTGAITAFVVPMFGRALWGVFGQSYVSTALWFGLIEGILTALIVLFLRSKIANRDATP